jgi:hypothetical protein
VLLIPGWLLTAAAAQQQTTPPAAAQPVPKLAPAEEELIAEKDASAEASDEEDTISEDGRHVAWRTKQGGKWVVVTDGRAQDFAFDEVRAITFSPDGLRVAYRGKRGGKWVAVVDGQPQTASYDETRSWRFSPDSKHVAFPAKREGKWWLVLDGAERWGPYEDLRGGRFSRDGARFEVIAKKGKKWLLLSDGKEGPEYQDLALALYGPGERRMAYVAQRDGHYFVVLDGKEGPPFDVIGGPTFNLDGTRFAYSGVQLDGNKGKGQVIVDGQEGRLFQGGDPDSFLKVLLTQATTSLLAGCYQTLRADWHGVSEPLFSLLGGHVAYAARRAKKDLVAVIDGQEGPSFEAILLAPQFSEDGEHVAYVVKDKGTLTTIVDGKRVGESPAEGVDAAEHLTWDSDGRHVAMVGVWGGTGYDQGRTPRARRRVFLDGQPGTEYNALAVSNLRFSPSGRRFAYAVHDIGDGISVVVVDGAESKRYNGVWGRFLAFDGESALTWIAQTGRKFLRVRQPLGE